jgi:hypothetical protein
MSSSRAGQILNLPHRRWQTGNTAGGKPALRAGHLPRALPAFGRAAGLVVFLVSCAVTVFAGGGPPLPPLLPAHGELPPTFWEQHGWSVALVVVAALAFIALVVIWLTRPAPGVVIPPELVARRALEALRNQSEDGPLLMRVSGILRHYLMHACGLPVAERTTTELCRELAALPRLDRGLVEAIAAFLRQCDERKFSPEPPVAPSPAVAAALEIVARVEAHNRQPAPGPPPIPPAARMAATPS